MSKLNFFLIIFLLTFLPLTSYAQDWAGLPQIQFNYRGNWSNTSTYNSNDAVRGSNAKLYVGVEDNIPINTDPTTSTRYWAEAISNRGNPGQTGPRGNSIDAIFILSTTTPALPTNPSYSNGTFNNIDSWSNVIPSGSDPVWIALYNIDASDSLTYITHKRISGIRGPPGQSITGEKGDSIGAIFIRSSSIPILPNDNDGLRVGNEITIPPSGWALTAETTNGNDDLYTVLAKLPGGNADIDYFTILKLSGERGDIGRQGLQGQTGLSGNSIAVVYQRKTGSAPSLPSDNTGTRSGLSLVTAPIGWSLTEPSGTDPLYIALASLPGSSASNIDYQLIIKLTGEQGRQGRTGNSGIDGQNGYSTRLIYRKSLQLDLLQSPVVTYDGIRPPDANSLTLPNDDWSVEPYVTRSFNSFLLDAGNNSPQALDYDGIRPPDANSLTLPNDDWSVEPLSLIHI